MNDNNLNIASVPLGPQGPWSVDENGTLKYNEVSHKVVPLSTATSKVLNIFKKTSQLDDIKSVVEKLNKDYAGGITNTFEIKVKGKTFSVAPPELSEKYGDIAREAKIAPKHLHDVIALATPLMKNDGYTLNKSLKDMFKAVADLPPGKRQEIIDVARPLILACENEADKPKMLKAVATLLPQERETIVACTTPLIQYCRYEDLTKILQAVVSMPKDQRKNIADVAVPLVEQRAYSSERLMILKAIVALSPDSRQAIVNLTTPLLEQFDARDQAEILKMATNKTAAEWKGVLDQALPEIKNMSDFDKLQTLKSYASMASNEGQDIINDAKPLLQIAKGSYERSVFLEAVGNMPKAERSNIIASAIPLFGNTDSIGRQVILKTIADLPNEQRQDIMLNAAPLLQGANGYMQVCQVIDAVQRLSPDQRADIIAVATRLLRPDMNVEAKIFIVSSVSNMQANRLTILNLATPLLQHITNPFEKITILNALADIPEAQRQSTIERIMPFVNEDTSGTHIVWFIRTQGYQAIPQGALGGTPYKITISREDFKDNPLETLNVLIEKFKQKNSSVLSIEFIGEQGIDAGGLGREFVSLLFDALKDKMKFKLLDNGLYRPVVGDAKVYHQLGELMMFCLNASREYPTGMIFDQGLFSALSQLKPNHLEQDFDILVQDEQGFQELVAIYADMNSIDETQLKYMQKLKLYASPLTLETDEAILREAFTLYGSGNEDVDDAILSDGITINIEVLKQHLPAVQAAIRKAIIEEKLSSELRPIIELAKGMKGAKFTTTSWDAVQKMKPSELSEKLQGKVTKEMIIEKLEFDAKISAEKQQWIKDWVQNADFEKIKRFLFAMTGAFALGNVGLKIHQSSESVMFHTCFNSVDVPLATIQSKDLFNAVMEGALTGNEKYSRG